MQVSTFDGMINFASYPNLKYLAIVVDFFIDSQVRQGDIGVIERQFE